MVERLDICIAISACRRGDLCRRYNRVTSPGAPGSAVGAFLAPLGGRTERSRFSALPAAQRKIRPRRQRVKFPLMPNRSQSGDRMPRDPPVSNRQALATG